MTVMQPALSVMQQQSCWQQRACGAHHRATRPLFAPHVMVAAAERVMATGNDARGRLDQQRPHPCRDGASAALCLPQTTAQHSAHSALGAPSHGGLLALPPPVFGFSELFGSTTYLRRRCGSWRQLYHRQHAAQLFAL
jgi:hypothetical protein